VSTFSSFIFPPLSAKRSHTSPSPHVSGLEPLSSLPLPSPSHNVFKLQYSSNSYYQSWFDFHYYFSLINHHQPSFYFCFSPSNYHYRSSSFHFCFSNDGHYSWSEFHFSFSLLTFPWVRILPLCIFSSTCLLSLIAVLIYPFHSSFLSA
jgi:hypothetical protein